MAYISRTINPLHFEDLEPHRFEDLVRQLIYDFRDWRTLEATGRAGSDDGFDVRAWESISDLESSTEPDEDEEGEVTQEAATTEDRIWLIQCKREKVIAPRKMGKYIDDIKINPAQPLYGMIFVASCDFSKRTRDIFIDAIRRKGVQEFRLWGKAELEDMLFQPKNDHLLFAYFGFSLAIRRRSVKNKILAKLATKRKLVRCFGDIRQNHCQPVLIRDVNDTTYPHRDKTENGLVKWKLYNFLGHYEDGIVVLLRKFFAYLADDGIHWDCVENVDEIGIHDDPWKKENPKEKELHHKVWAFWVDIPERNRAWFEVAKFIPYERIVAVDKDGDNYTDYPHIYVPFEGENGPFDESCYRGIKPSSRYAKPLHHPEEQNRIKFFPDDFPDPREVEKKESVNKA